MFQCVEKKVRIHKTIKIETKGKSMTVEKPSKIDSKALYVDSSIPASEVNRFKSKQGFSEGVIVS